MLKIIHALIFLLLTFGLIGAIESAAADRHDYRPGYSGGFHDRHSRHNAYGTDNRVPRSSICYPKSYIVYDIPLFDKLGNVLEPRPIVIRRENKTDYRPGYSRRYHEHK